MQYCSLQHRTLLPSPVTSTNGCCFCFGSTSSFFLESFLYSSPVAYWAPTDLGLFIFQCHIFLPFHTVHGVLKARILKWFAIAFTSEPHFVRSLLLWPVCFLNKTLLAFALLNFYSKAKLACYSRYLLTSYFCISVPYDEKGIFFCVSSRRSCRSS